MKQSGLVLSVDRIVVPWGLVLVCVLHRNKTMVAVYVTKIPCKFYKAHKVLGKPNFCNICLCATNIAYFRFEGFRNFLTLLWALLVKNFHVLRTTGKCTSCHLFLYAIRWISNMIDKVWGLWHVFKGDFIYMARWIWTILSIFILFMVTWDQFLLCNNFIIDKI